METKKNNSNESSKSIKMKTEKQRQNNNNTKKANRKNHFIYAYAHTNTKIKLIVCIQKITARGIIVYIHTFTYLRRYIQFWTDFPFCENSTKIELNGDERFNARHNHLNAYFLLLLLLLLCRMRTF